MESEAAQAPASFISRVRKSIPVAREEIAHTTTLQKLSLLASVGGQVYEWSPANEWVTGAMSSNVFEVGRNTDGILQPAINILQTGATTGVISGITQLGVGLLTAKAVRVFPDSFAVLSDNIGSEIAHNKPSVATAIALGTSAVVIEANYQNPNRIYRDDVILVGKAAGMIAIGNVLVGAGVSGIATALDATHNSGVADVIIEYAQNPLTYLAVFAIVKVSQQFKKRNTR